MNDILHDIRWVVPLRNEFLTPVFEVFTFMGYPTFVMLLLALGFWLWNKEIFTRVAVIVVFSTLLNAFLKDLWENPRPDLMFRLDGEVGDSFGMPSGHAQVSAVLWFWIAYEVGKAWAWIVAGIVVAGICFSRIYLGIHDLEDILAGLSLAAVSLMLYRYCFTPRFKKVRDASLYLHLLAIFIIGSLAKLTWPTASNSISALVALGLLFAWLIGRDFEAKRIGFKPRKESWALILIALIGVATVIGVSIISKPLFSGFDPLVAGIIRSALLGLTMTLIAPMMFKLCKLSTTN